MRKLRLLSCLELSLPTLRVLPTRPVAELLDMFLRGDFLPRYSAIRSSGGFSPKKTAADAASMAPAPADAYEVEEMPSTDYEWVEAAWRGGRERYTMRQLMHKRAPGRHLVTLAAEVAPALFR